MRGTLILTICLLVFTACKKEIVDIEANFTINGEDKQATVDIDNPPNIFTDADKVVHVEQNQKVVFEDKSKPIEAVHQRNWSISNAMSSKTEAKIDYKFKEIGPHPVVLEANGERIIKWVNVYHPSEGPPDGDVTFSDAAAATDASEDNGLVVLDRPEDKARKAKEAEQRRIQQAENRKKAEQKAAEDRREREKQYELDRKNKEKNFAANQKKIDQDRKNAQAKLESDRKKEQARLAAEREKEDARIAAQQKDAKNATSAQAERDRIERERKAEDEKRKKAQAAEDEKRKEAQRLETARLEKERKAKADADQKAKEEADRKAREAAARKEAERKTKEAEAAKNAISVDMIKFSASAKEVVIGDIITFKDNTTPNTSIEKRVWEFGDGQVRNSSSATTTYAFRKPGTYTVSLCINGQSDLCKEMLIKVNPLVKAVVSTGEFKCSTKSTAGALSSRICSSAGSEIWSNGSIITIKPKVRMELLEANVKVDKGGSVSVSLFEGNEDLGESSAYANKGLSQIVLSDLYVTLEAGKTYKLKIAPSSGQNLENISNCNPGGSSGPHFDLNYAGQIILFDIKYCYE